MTYRPEKSPLSNPEEGMDESPMLGRLRVLVPDLRNE